MSEVLDKFIRAAEYLAAVQVYLRGNYLLEESEEITNWAWQPLS